MSGKSINSWNSNLKMSRTPTKASTRDDKAKTFPLKNENNQLKKDDIFYSHHLPNILHATLFLKLSFTIFPSCYAFTSLSSIQIDPTSFANSNEP